MALHYLYFMCAAILLYSRVTDATDENLTFPDDFLIGSATSAYQIEGAWNASDKEASVWDFVSHNNPSKFHNNENADIACDSYHRFKEDVQILKKMGMKIYRFSISWPRLLPTANPEAISKDGLKYYNDLLDELKKNDIIPFVTLYHWDHPQLLQDYGGWKNETMINYFGDYARIVFNEFGDRVKMFITMNEPYEFCRQWLPEVPDFQTKREAEYICNTIMLKAHARAYHIYNDEFRTRQYGKIGITLNSFYYYNLHANDTISSEVAFQFMFGRYAHPIFSANGDYPEIVKQRVAENSKKEGRPQSRLPTISSFWLKQIKGSADFLGLNHYSSYLVSPAPESKTTIYPNDDGLQYTTDPAWPSCPSGWLKIVPQGFLDLLIKIHNDYGHIPIYITENGISDLGTLHDSQRIEYLRSYMKAMLTAMHMHGCNVKGYMIWSLIDNFEWFSAYREKFGLYQVNFTDPLRTRTPKDSATWVTEVIRTRKLQPLPKSNLV